jgi:hypothetical protein
MNRTLRVHAPKIRSTYQRLHYVRTKGISAIFSRPKSIKRNKMGSLINSERENVIKLQIKCLFLTFKMENILCVTNELNWIFYRHKLGKVYVTYTTVKFVMFFTWPFKNTFVSFAAHDKYSYCWYTVWSVFIRFDPRCEWKLQFVHRLHKSADSCNANNVDCRDYNYTLPTQGPADHRR